MSKLRKEHLLALRGWLAAPFNQGLLFLFGLAVFLIYPVFFPNLVDLGPFDEMILVNSGRNLVEGNWPNFANNPLVALLYGLAYLPVQHDPLWILQIAAIGRLVLFGLLWWSFYAVAQALRRLVHPFIPLAGLLVVVMPRKLLYNPSDALFAAMLTFALAQALAFVQDGEERRLWWVSAFLGLSALSRSDGLVAWGIFLGLAVFWALRRGGSWVLQGRRAAACMLPFALLAGGYVLFHAVLIGKFDTGLSGRSYIAFEQGHIASPGVDGNVRQVYGTPEENQFSILNAIRRNPGAFAARVRANLFRLPEQILDMYGKRMAVVLFLFALSGAWELLRRRLFSMLLILLACPLYLAVYGLTFFRDGYLIQPYAALMALVGIGAGCLLDDLAHPARRWWAWGAFSAACVLGLAANKLAIFAGAALFLAAILALRLLLPHLGGGTPRRLALAALLCAGLVVHGEYPSPAFRTLGQNPDEQAVIALGQALPPNARVLTLLPGPVLASRMYSVSVSADWTSAETPGELLSRLTGPHGVQAIYLEANFYHHEPALWAQIEALEGRGLERIAQFDEGSIQIFRVTER